jgi:hypothetical protein
VFSAIDSNFGEVEKMQVFTFFYRGLHLPTPPQNSDRKNDFIFAENQATFDMRRPVPPDWLPFWR